LSCVVFNCQGGGSIGVLCVVIICLVCVCLVYWFVSNRSKGKGKISYEDIDWSTVGKCLYTDTGNISDLSEEDINELGIKLKGKSRRK
jgi:hypothetical protein